MKTLRRLSLLVLLFALTGFSNKKAPFAVTFHVEANQMDTSTFSVPIELKNLKRQVYVEKMPSITEREISAIYPFPANDGSMGCAFRLDNHGRIWLDTISMEKRGMAMIARVNGRFVCDMLIDKRVSDGIITIPDGLSLEDIKVLKRKFKVMGSGKKGAPVKGPRDVD